MPVPPRRTETRSTVLHGPLVAALIAAVLPASACTEPAGTPELFLNLSVTPRRVNVADLADGLSRKIRIAIASPNAPDGSPVAVSVNDYVLIEDYGSFGLVEGGPTSFAIAVVNDGQSELGARCVGNAGTAEISAFLLDSRGQPVGEATATVDCYLDDGRRYALSLDLGESVAAVGDCVTAKVHGIKDNGRAAEGLSVSIGCDGCRQQGQTPEALAAIPAGELNNREFFLDGEGRAETSLCCLTPGRVGVRTDWTDDAYGDPDRVATESITCIEEGGEARILIASDRSDLRVGDSPDSSRTKLTITVLGPGGVPRADVRLQLVQTSNGTLDPEDRQVQPGHLTQRVDNLRTDERGTASVWLWAGVKPGEARITVLAVLNLDGQEPLTLKGEHVVPIIGLGAIDCVEASEAYLTVAGSGGAETAQVCFRVTSTADAPLPDFPVVFDLPTALRCQGDASACGSAWIVPERARSDAQGMACTFLHAGRMAQPVSVRATGRLHGAALVSDCPALPVVGGRPSARGLALSCDLKNVGALMDDDGVNVLVRHEIPCQILVKDRYGNPVPSPTNVAFRTEAGTITHSVSTPGRTGGQGGDVDNPAIAVAQAVFQTFGQLPKDVSPLPRDPERGRETAEPNYTDGVGIVHNPRDGFVTVIAYTIGEEEFTDVNGNGVFDAGEPFTDLAEPFIDADDSGLRDLDELFIDLAPPTTEEDRRANCPEGVAARRSRGGVWDGPNGCWDDSSIIWTQTRILYTGAPFTLAAPGGAHDQKTSGFLDFGLLPFVSRGSPRFQIQKGDIQRIKVRFVDANLNLLNASAAYAMATRGPVEIVPGTTSPFTLADSWGLEFTVAKTCNNATGVCTLVPRFGRFSLFAADTASGYDFQFDIASNAPPDGPCCAPTPAGPDEPLELLPEDRDDERCAAPEGFAFPDEIDDAPPPDAGGEGEGEEADPPSPWLPAVFEPTDVQVKVTYGVSPTMAGEWTATYALQGRGCGTIVLDDASADEIETPTSCLRGVVLGPRDVPVAGASVEIQDPPPGFVPAPAITDDAGEYCLISSLGRTKIVAEFVGEDGFTCRSASASVQVEAGESECDGDCRPGPELTCEVVEGEGGGR